MLDVELGFSIKIQDSLSIQSDGYDSFSHKVVWFFVDAVH